MFTCVVHVSYTIACSLCNFNEGSTFQGAIYVGQDEL